MALIPFSWLPASWGLRGPLREEAQARYELSGEELDRRLAEIKLVDDLANLKRAYLEIDYKYKHIAEYYYDKSVVMLADYVDEREREVALVDVDLKHGTIEEIAGDKAKAGIMGVAWLRVIDQDFDPAKPVGGFSLEFDWNDHWVDAMRASGFVGATGEDVFEQWYEAVICRQALNDLVNGIDPNEPEALFFKRPDNL